MKAIIVNYLFTNSICILCLGEWKERDTNLIYLKKKKETEKIDIL